MDKKWTLADIEVEYGKGYVIDILKKKYNTDNVKNDGTYYFVEDKKIATHIKYEDLPNIEKKSATSDIRMNLSSEDEDFYGQIEKHEQKRQEPKTEKDFFNEMKKQVEEKVKKSYKKSPSMSAGEEFEESISKEKNKSLEDDESLVGNIKNIFGKKEKSKEEPQEDNETENNSTSSDDQKERLREQKDEEQRQKEEKRIKLEEDKEILEGKRKKALEDLKIKFEEKRKNIETGPHGIRKLVTNDNWFHFITWVDAGLSTILLIGPALGFFWTLGMWSILSLIGGYGLRPVFSIFIVQVFDFFWGLIIDVFETTLAAITGTLSIALTPIISGGLDLLPEYLAPMFGAVRPGKMMLIIYEKSIPDELQELEEKYQEEIKDINKDFDDQKKGLISNYNSKARKAFGKGFSKIRKMNNSQVISFIFIVFISVFGPFGLGYINTNQSGFILAGLTIAILITFYFTSLIKVNQMFAVILFLVFCLFYDRSQEALSKIPMGANAYIAPFLMVALMFLFILKLQFDWDTKIFFGIVMALFILLSMPFMYSYVSSPYFAEQMEENAMATKIQIQEMSIGDKAKLWFEYQTKLGKGEIVEAGVQEKTQQFIGVTILGVKPTYEQVKLGDPVNVNMFYKSGSYRPILLWSNCKIEKNQGTILNNDKNKNLSAGFHEGVISCVINNVPKGVRQIEFISGYNFVSSVEVNLKLINKDFLEKLNRISAVDSEKIDVEKYVGGTIKPRTSSGPVTIGVSNTFSEGKLTYKSPMIVDKKKILPIKLTFQLQPLLMSENTNVKDMVSMINSVTLDSPKGLIYNCSFTKEPIKFVDYGNNRTKATISGKNIVIETYTTFECDVRVDENFKDTFIPDNGFSVNTISATVDYEYYMHRSAAVTVK
jgi:hypothetical protein